MKIFGVGKIMAHGTQSWSKTSGFSSVEVKVEIRDWGGGVF